jgi:uncharacterized membrane protein YjjP (DUF1212 family)
MNLTKGIILLLGFTSSMVGYSLYPFLWDESWYHLNAFAFMCYTFVIYSLTKGPWSVVSLVIFLSTVNSFVDELMFDPKVICMNEYIGFLVTIFIAVLQRRKWER